MQGASLASVGEEAQKIFGKREEETQGWRETSRNSSTSSSQPALCKSVGRRLGPTPKERRVCRDTSYRLPESNRSRPGVELDT